MLDIVYVFCLLYNLLLQEYLESVVLATFQVSEIATRTQTHYITHTHTFLTRLLSVATRAQHHIQPVRIRTAQGTAAI